MSYLTVSMHLSLGDKITADHVRAEGGMDVQWLHLGAPDAQVALHFDSILDMSQFGARVVEEARKLAARSSERYPPPLTSLPGASGDNAAVATADETVQS